MTTQQAWYIGQRAESLAVMYLTRRNDLIVLKQEENYGLDFLVTIKKSDNYSGRLFGVEVKATASNSKIIVNENTAKIKLQYLKIDYLFELPFPVCLFFFTLNNDQGYYKWLLEPIIGGETNSKLNFNEQNEFKKLTNEEIDNIVATVNFWYDNRK